MFSFLEPATVSLAESVTIFTIDLIRATQAQQMKKKRLVVGNCFPRKKTNHHQDHCRELQIVSSSFFNCQ